MELTYQRKIRAEQLEKERKHYAHMQKIREDNKRTREVRALKLQQQQNQTQAEKHARKLERNRKSRQ